MASPFRRGGLVHAVLSFCLLAVLWQFYGFTMMAFLGLTGQITGLLCFFPVLYRLYTSNVVGYNFLRNAMHPRQPAPHSHADVWRDATLPGIAVLPVPVLLDNYAYIVWCEATMEAAVVDPADPHAVSAAADRLGVEITTIIATHKHWDHAGGNRELQEFLDVRRSTRPAGTKITVLGSREDHPHSTTKFVGEGSTYDIGKNIRVAFRMVPGHTRGHVLTLVTSAAASTPDPLTVAFTGDSLFCCGVGMFFECDDVEDLQRTYDVYHGLDGNRCWVFPGHEYSEMLANQAASVDASNVAARKCLSEFSRLRRHKHCTVPSLLQTEKDANPFLRIPRRAMEAFTTPKEVQDAMYAPVHRC